MSVNGYAVGTDGDGVHLWKTATRKRVGKLVEGTSASAWILPDPDKGILKVVIHAMASPRLNRAIEHLLENLNDAQFNYPGTHLRLVYTLSASDDPKSETGVT